MTPDLILAEVISYPSVAASSKKVERVIFQVSIDSLGNMESSKLVEFSHPAFAEEAIRAINYLKANWYSELLVFNPPNSQYLIVMSFIDLRVQKDPQNRLAKAERLIARGKLEKAFPILNQLIEEYPYEIAYLKIRAKAFGLMQNYQDTIKDREKIVYLEKTVLANLTTFSISKRSRNGVPISF